MAGGSDTRRGGPGSSRWTVRSSLRTRAPLPPLTNVPSDDVLRRARKHAELEQDVQDWRHALEVRAEHDEIDLRERKQRVEFTDRQRSDLHRPRLAREWVKTVRQALVLTGVGGLLYLAGAAEIGPGDLWNALQSVR